MAIAKGHGTNFETLRKAFASDDVCLLECTEKATGKPVVVLCMVNRVGEDRVFVPVARMFSGNPYDELIPPK